MDRPPSPQMTDRLILLITVDTEEDDWASYSANGASTRNIAHLPVLQEVFDRWGARPTYLVNRPPLLDHDAVDVLGELARKSSVEIGAHCHPWNTPPLRDEGAHRSMMCTFSRRENRAKVREIRSRLEQELGVAPRVFRAGRWGFGPTVAEALVDEGFEIDCSVTPFIDWSAEAGSDFSDAPRRPYRFHPSDPLRPDPEGSLLEFPPTIGFLSGDQRNRHKAQRWLRGWPLRHLRLVGVFDRSGLLTRRWLSPERSSGETMMRLAEALLSAGQTCLHLTMHSCTLLPGATPFVRDEHDRTRLLQSLNQVLSYFSASGFEYRTLSEAGQTVRIADGTVATT